jgi:hypothetical protein
MDAHLFPKIVVKPIRFGVLLKILMLVTHIILDSEIAIKHNLLPIAAWYLKCIVMDHALKIKLIHIVIVDHMVITSDLIVDAFNPP